MILLCHFAYLAGWFGWFVGCVYAHFVALQVSLAFRGFCFGGGGEIETGKQGNAIQIRNVIYYQIKS